jgi:hypothetical protein
VGKKKAQPKGDCYAEKMAEKIMIFVLFIRPLKVPQLASIC